MISPEEAFDPIAFSDELIKWEDRIDSHLKRFFDGTPEEMTFYFTDFKKEPKYVRLYQGMREVLLKRYRQAGWEVKIESKALTVEPWLGWHMVFTIKKNWWK